MTREEKIAVAKEHVIAKIGDIIERNYDQSGGALETPGAFTALLEAYKAIEIFETRLAAENSKLDVDAYLDSFRSS